MYATVRLAMCRYQEHPCVPICAGGRRKDSLVASEAWQVCSMIRLIVDNLTGPTTAGQKLSSRFQPSMIVEGIGPWRLTKNMHLLLYVLDSTAS
jgi:hypothetical protein